MRITPQQLEKAVDAMHATSHPSLRAALDTLGISVEEELKPCPFCGKTVVMACATSRYAVGCVSCEFEGPARVSREYAREAWNQRTP